jgi:hypothetical protein
VRLLARPSDTLSSVRNGGENTPNIVRALRPVTGKALGHFSLASRLRREERVGERRNSFLGCPSLRLSPRSCLAGRERKCPFEPPVTGQGRGEEVPIVGSCDLPQQVAKAQCEVADQGGMALDDDPLEAGRAPGDGLVVLHRHRRAIEEAAAVVELEMTGRVRGR